MPEGKRLFEKHPGLSTALLVVFVFFVIEAGVRLLSLAKYFHPEVHPTISTSNKQPVFLDDIHPVFGVWHYPNAVTRHKSRCFDVTYQSNSFGMRDVDRNLRSEARRVLVLGDSFVEGLGVPLGKRMTDLLENWTGMEHLNFGASGDFGSIQQWLLYRELGMKFDHTEVFIFMLPFNDFADNDPNNFNQKRFRPYLRKTASATDTDWEVFYPVDFEKRERNIQEVHNIGYFKSIQNTITNNVYSYNLARQVTRLAKSTTSSKNLNNTSSYDDYTQNDLDILIYTYRKIAELAFPRTVYVFSIPIDRDFVYFYEKGYNFSLVEAIRKFASDNSNIVYIDLLPLFVSKMEQENLHYKDLELACDGHWGVSGHRFAAQIIFDKVSTLEKVNE